MEKTSTAGPLTRLCASVLVLFRRAFPAKGTPEAARDACAFAFVAHLAIAFVIYGDWRWGETFFEELFQRGRGNKFIFAGVFTVIYLVARVLVRRAVPDGVIVETADQLPRRPALVAGASFLLWTVSLPVGLVLLGRLLYG
jgi:hypothetical protein